MPNTLIDSGRENERQSERSTPSIVTGTVVSNFDLVMQGKVLVRLPFSGQEVWARLTALGAGGNRGFFFVPQPEDEVLVALSQDDPNDAFVLGGLWNTQDRIPAIAPTDALSQRTLRTGIAGVIGHHELKFDDALRRITITTSGLTPIERQQITMDPTKIELSNLAGTVKITLDNTQQTISIQAANIELNGLAQIKIQAPRVEINGTATTQIRGGLVTIN